LNKVPDTGVIVLIPNGTPVAIFGNSMTGEDLVLEVEAGAILAEVG
jgi:hypothetical protein